MTSWTVRNLRLAAVLMLPTFLPATAFGQESPQFSITSYMGRCLDFGPTPLAPGTVSINDCNKTAAQRMGVEEIPTLGAHQIRLRCAPLT